MTSLLGNLSFVSSGPVPPMVVTIMGDAGTAKTSLGSLFPNPLFIRLEDGTKSIPTDRQVMQTPVLQSSADVIAYLSEIHAAPGEVKTMCFDSVTRLNALIVDEIVASDPKKPKSINQAMGGWGAGEEAVAKVHRVIKSWCDAIARDHGINSVFIAHQKIALLDSPDIDAYSRYGLKMHDKSVAVYVDDVDMVAQLKHSVVVIKGDSELAESKAKRIGGIEIHAVPVPSSPVKNRYQIKDTIMFEENVFPFESIIKTGRYEKDFNVDKSTGEVNGTA